MNNPTALRRFPLGMFPGQPAAAARSRLTSIGFAASFCFTTCGEPHVAPFLCHPSAGGRLRHPDRAGAFGAQGRQDHDGLQACVEPRRAGGSQPAAPAPEAHVRRDWEDYADRPVSVKSRTEGCEMQRKSLQAKQFWPQPARSRVRLRLTGRGLALVKRNGSWA